MHYLPAQRLKLYRNFKSLKVNDFYGVVRYYEEFEEGIRALEFDEYFDCTFTYANGLYQTGQYGKHIVMCDHLLELVIMENVETWGGGDVYAEILFKKASSLLNIQENDQAEHVLRELLKLYPADRPTMRALRSCLLRARPQWLLKTRAIAVAVLLFTAIAIAAELFIINPFFSDYNSVSRQANNFLMIAGASLLVVGEFIHLARNYRRVFRFALKMKKRKQAEDHLQDQHFRS